MDVIANATGFTAGPDTSYTPYLASNIVSDQFKSPLAVGVTAALTVLVSTLAYLIYRPAVHPQSPAFTSDTIPILGSFGFVSRQW